MTGFWLTILMFVLMGLGPILNMVFDVPLVALMWFYWGIVIGQPIGVLASKAQREDEARKKR